jgi:hypothetical protein
VANAGEKACRVLVEQVEQSSFETHPHAGRTEHAPNVTSSGLTSRQAELFEFPAFGLPITGLSTIASFGCVRARPYIRK